MSEFSLLCPVHAWPGCYTAEGPFVYPCCGDEEGQIHRALESDRHASVCLHMWQGDGVCSACGAGLCSLCPRLRAWAATWKRLAKRLSQERRRSTP